MPFINTRVHGVTDYIVGLLLAASPWLFDFARGGAETWVPLILGIGTLAYSLMTDYELGAVRAVPMRMHLWLDMLSGLVLLVSPWLFGFGDFVRTPHIVFGLLAIGVAAITDPVPGRGHARAAVPHAESR